MVKLFQSWKEREHMANTAYARQQIGLYLKHFRLNAQDSSIRTQTGLGAVLGLDQKRVSNIECGYDEPSLKVAADWCRLTGWFEGWDLISHIYGLDPFGFVPVDPALNQSVSDALHNLRRQLKQALDAVEQLIEEEPAVSLAIRRGSYKPSQETKHHEKQVADLIPAVKTYFYSLEREKRSEMKEIGYMWNLEALTEQVAMPRIDQLGLAAAIK
jgi:DNA-binding XRE family transcriptional regulator